MKTRRNVRSLGSDEIAQVKKELVTVQARYLSDAGITPNPSYVVDELPRPRNIKPKQPKSLDSEDRPLDIKREEGATPGRRKSQSSKQPEGEFSEQNSLFMFAVLATEGVSNNQ